MTGFRNEKIQAVALGILAVAASQVLQIILYLFLATLLREATDPGPDISQLLSLLPAILATLGGGLFLGRLRHDSSRGYWMVTAVAAALFPVLIQLLIYPDVSVWLGSGSVWLSVAGSAIIWYIGCLLGRMTLSRHPDPVLDKHLLRWTAGITGAVIVLYLATWSSMVLSEGYRAAKSVELPIPPGVEEVRSSIFEPGVAASRHFTATIPAGDTHLQQFYIDHLSEPAWVDVSSDFQEWVPGEWHFTRETRDDQQKEYALAGGHWRTDDSRAAVSLIMQARKSDEQKAWEDTDWKIQGMILSRPYSKPPAAAQNDAGQTPSPEKDPEPEIQNTGEPLDTPLPTIEGVK